MFHWVWTWPLFALNQDGYGDFVSRTRSIWSTSGVSTVFHQELGTCRDQSTSFKSECLRAFRCPPSCDREKKMRQEKGTGYFSENRQTCQGKKRGHSEFPGGGGPAPSSLFNLSH